MKHLQKLLNAHLEKGTIALVQSEYIGNAADGRQVTLGYEDEENLIERYLKLCPEPTDW